MRKLIASGLGAGALMAVTLSLTAAPASADPIIDANKFCSDHADFGYGHGACVSLLESNGTSRAIIVSFCKDLLQQDPSLPSVEVKNLGACVSAGDSQAG